MAKIQEVSGFLAEALCINVCIVEAHVRGLRSAGRLKSNDVGPWEAADLLCALLSPDETNATGPYHLPYVGAALEQANGAAALVPEDSELFKLFGVEFGEAVCSLIEVAENKPDPPYIGHIEVTGRGETLRAAIAYETPDGMLWAFFGYRLLPDLLTQKPNQPLSLQGRLFVDIGITAALGQLIAGRSVVEFVPSMRVEVTEARH